MKQSVFVEAHGNGMSTYGVARFETSFVITSTPLLRATAFQVLARDLAAVFALVILTITLFCVPKSNL